ncbi:hypothetical protein [Burkholderia cenocepacia]|uniref:hypothetical protein n=1 Tax=Burkholderia cenocepacia TaxID=95486 RepID=UPI00097C1D57|nr:hypothetical protein [Burkholderia cenocepacia]AQQ17349.1 hypothetical protein A8D61_02155 [Burkholderia cenocepacia]ONJ17706.1 hypothetical protein A8D82_30690 [Burkholderia cenocepacia]ONN91530.1 hypothetical protein A8D63_11285 [Burkholderia cenocepacia]ONN94776.1 hypothetical protein A8D62_10090 [Burkholderia cenocepacia]ONN94882.1 hypothetical protein A8D64_02105 [Burkholderia cenocepacia]
MLEALKNAVTAAVEALTNNGEHRASLAAALKAAHDTVAALEERVTALETKIEAGFTAAGAVAAVVDPLIGGGAPVQVETKPAA